MRLAVRHIAVLALFAAAPLAAQVGVSADDISAYRALMLTPVGALPPIATSTITGEVQSGVAFAVRYGYVGGGDNLSSLNNFGATAILPFGIGTTVSLTGGVAAISNGSSSLMLSIGGDTRITSLPFGSAGGSRLGIGLNGELGYGKPRENDIDEHVVSLAVGLPLSLLPGTMARDAMRIVPWVTPAFGYGNETFDDGVNQTFSGSRFMIGGGLGFYNPSSSVSFSVGVQYVSIANAQLEVGGNVVLGGR